MDEDIPALESRYKRDVMQNMQQQKSRTDIFISVVSISLHSIHRSLTLIHFSLHVCVVSVVFFDVVLPFHYMANSHRNMRKNNENI